MRFAYRRIGKSLPRSRICEDPEFADTTRSVPFSRPRRPSVLRKRRFNRKRSPREHCSRGDFTLSKNVNFFKHIFRGETEIPIRSGIISLRPQQRLRRFPQPFLQRFPPPLPPCRAEPAFPLIRQPPLPFLPYRKILNLKAMKRAKKTLKQIIQKKRFLPQKK